MAAARAIWVQRSMRRTSFGSASTSGIEALNLAGDLHRVGAGIEVGDTRPRPIVPASSASQAALDADPNRAEHDQGR